MVPIVVVAVALEEVKVKNQISKILQDLNPTFAEFKRQSNIGLKFSDTKSHASGYDEPTNSDC